MHTSFYLAVSAIRSGELTGLKKLIKKQPELIHAKFDMFEDRFPGSTLLHQIAGNPSHDPLPSNIVDITKFLLAAGSEVDARSGDGSTTLCQVVSSSNVTMVGAATQLVDLLVKAGADIHIDDGRIMWLAAHHGEVDALKAVYKHGGLLDLGFACALGELEMVKCYFNGHGQLVEDSPRQYRPQKYLTSFVDTPQTRLEESFGFALKCGQTQIAAYLIEKGIDINSMNSPLFPGSTALHVAAQHAWLDLAGFLIDKGATINARDKENNATPTDLAAFNAKNRQFPGDWAKNYEAMTDLLRKRGGLLT